MKTFVNGLASAVAGLFLVGCGDLDSLAKPSAQPSLPVTRKLTNTEGKTIYANIIGRDLNSLTLVRKEDGKTFTYPIEDLSSADQQFARDLPLVAAPVNANPEAETNRQSSGLTFLLAEEKELNAEIARVTEALMRSDPETIQGRSLFSQHRKLSQEHARLMEEIHEAKSR